MTDPDSFTVTVPSRLRLGRRMYPLNLNLYRNAHYIVKAKLKDLFAETVRRLLPPVRYDIIEIRYDVWFGSSRRQDVMNVGAVIDKFFEDCLVSNGIIPDDNSYHVIDTHFRYAGVSKNAPHVDITVTADRRSYG